MRIGIIGSGIAGLAVAVRLAARGHEVNVYEANSDPGGKLTQFALQDCRFDLGPSLFTMPHYIDELFLLAGEEPREHFQYQRLSTICRYFWEDGTRLQAHADKYDFAREAEKKLRVHPESILSTLADSARKYELTGRIFLEKSLHQFATWRDRQVIAAIFNLPSLDIFTTMNRVNEKQLRHPKMVQLFNRFATYNGSNPYKAPGLLNIIPHFEHGIGAFFPRGGMYTLTRAIYQLARRQGVRFHFDQNVEEITIGSNGARGVRTNGREHTFDSIVSNMDVYYTYKKLLPAKYRPRRLLNRPKSTSAVIFYWRIKGEFPELGLHNILFSNDYKREFETLEQGGIAADPTVYINITSKHEPDDAPAGRENWFTMINAPCDQGQEWDTLLKTARKNIISKISRILGTELEPLIEGQYVLDPRGIQELTRSHLGALYGNSSNSRLAAFMRHPNFSRRISNLYFCGGSVHPGGGIPLCLLSAKITAQQL